MDVVGAPLHVGAGGLAGAGIEVYPAPGERLLQRRHIVGTERSHGGQDLIPRLIDAVIERHAAHERRIEVVVMELAHTEHALAELEVTMELGQVLIHTRHERGVDARGDVRAVERSRQRRVVLPCTRLEQRRLDTRTDRRPQRAAEPVQSAEEAGHGLLAIASVR